MTKKRIYEKQILMDWSSQGRAHGNDDCNSVSSNNGDCLSDGTSAVLYFSESLNDPGI